MRSTSNWPARRTSSWPTRGRFCNATSRNYIADWWEKYVYLRGRSPIPINSNYYVMDGAGSPPTELQTARAANLVHGVMQFHRLLARDQLPPTLIRGLVPLCMDQYRRLFSTNRVPGRDCDHIKHWGSRRSKHIVVWCGGYFFHFPLYLRGRLLAPWQIEIQLERVMKWVSSVPPPPDHERHLAALTGWQRTRWAEAREECFAEGVARRSLEVVESALFHLVLDDARPATRTEQARLLFHGCGFNRWFDKSFTVVVFGNGKAGLNAEHAWADAPVVAHLWEHTLVTEWGGRPLNADGTPAHAAYGPDGRSVIPRNVDAEAFAEKAHAMKGPMRIAWELPAMVVPMVARALTATRALIADIDLQVVEHDAFGKQLMKRCRVSPDAFIQLAMQLAYRRMHGKFALTYESAMTRLFRYGRTETVRPCSVESCAWVSAFIKTSGRPAASELVALFRKAADVHQDAYKRAMAGEGVDRHLFGLYVVSVGKGMESAFLKDALSEPWRLSTSQQPQQQTTAWDMHSPDHQHLISPGGGFGPVADDGYGTSYMVAGSGRVFFHVSSKRSCADTDSARFAAAISAALCDVRDMFAEAGVLKGSAGVLKGSAGALKGSAGEGSRGE